MTIERVRRVESVLNHRQPDLKLFADGVHKPHNLSALIRTCDAVGIGDFHVLQSRRFRVRRGIAMGAHQWVNVHFHESPLAPLVDVKDQGFQLVAADLTDQSVDYRQIDFTKPTALVMGAERGGVSDEVLALCDAQVVIPMVGMVESFNVSVAAAIILAHARHQREQAGFYEQRRIDGQQYESLRFRWLQPKLAKMCDEWGVPFPQLDDCGDLLEPSKWLAAAQKYRRNSS